MRYREISEHFDITETEAFKRWFDGSRVVDESGRPLRMYHGTSHSNIQAFEVGFNSWGNKEFAGNHKVVSFSTDSEFANRYAGNPLDSDRSRRPVLYPVYIRSVNPGDFRNPEHVEAVKAIRHARWEKWLLSAKAQYPAIWTPEKIEQTRETEFKNTDALIEHGAWQAWENPSIWQKMGWDGAWSREDPFHTHKDVLNFAVSDGRQVKSAVGNRTFNPTSPKLTD